MSKVFGRIGYRGYTVNDIVDANEGAIALSPSNISDGKMILNKKTYISWEKYYESPEIMIEEEDIIFCKTGSSYGKVAIVTDLTEDMTINPQMIVIKPIDCFPKYLYYSLESQYIKRQVELIVGGGTMPTINQNDILNMNLFKPSFIVQKQIANFLDQKTTEIDDLIEKKEKLIKLLEEKRQATITEAVTKGLDPNVKMKGSGVEWIGEIPEHWEVSRLKYLFEIKKRIESLNNPNILSVTQKGIKIKDISNNEGQLAGNYDKYQTVQIGDFVMNHMDLLTGFIDISKFKGVTSPDYRVFSIKEEKFVRQYFLYYFQMSYYRRIFYKFGQGVSSFGRWRLPTDEFYNFWVPVPTIEEQKKIVTQISSHLADSDNVIEHTKNTINKLKEYRQSLIYEAVTGKIDVREMMDELRQEEVFPS